MLEKAVAHRIRSGKKLVELCSQSIRTILARRILVLEKTAFDPCPAELYECARAHPEMGGHFGRCRRALFSKQSQKPALPRFEIAQKCRAVDRRPLFGARGRGSHLRERIGHAGAEIADERGHIALRAA